MSVCPKCGLPEELCICRTIAKSAQKIKVSVARKRYGKFVTIIEGIDSSKINIKALAKKMKSKLACGGTQKQSKIVLQGDHRSRIKELLIKEGFPKEIIEIE